MVPTMLPIKTAVKGSLWRRKKNNEIAENWAITMEEKGAFIYFDKPTS